MPMFVSVPPTPPSPNTLIFSEDLVSASNSFSIFTVPDYAKKIIISIEMEGTATGNVGLEFNGDTGSNYVYQLVQGSGATVSAGTSSLAYAHCGGFTADIPSQYEITIINPKNTTFQKNWISILSGISIGVFGYRWSSTNAINTIKVKIASGGGNFKAGSLLKVWSVI
jgi:hypothetical protein